MSDDPGQRITENHYHTHSNGNSMFGKLISTLLRQRNQLESEGKKIRWVS